MLKVAFLTAGIFASALTMGTASRSEAAVPPEASDKATVERVTFKNRISCRR